MTQSRGLKIYELSMFLLILSFYRKNLGGLQLKTLVSNRIGKIKIENQKRKNWQLEIRQPSRVKVGLP